MNMRIEIKDELEKGLLSLDVIYMSMRIETFTMEELKEMESDNWTPTKKVSEFLQK